MNANFGIVLSDLPERAKDKKEQLAIRALSLISDLKATV
jgi:hypothetical protein